MQECLDKNQMTGAVLSPAIGYDKAAEVIKKAREGKKTVRELVVQLGYMDEKEARRLLDPESMTHQKKPRLKKRRG